VGVAGGEHEPADPGQVRVRAQRLDHPVRETAPSVRGQHEYVTDPDERGPVGDRPGEPDLASPSVEPEGERVRHGTFHHIAGHSFGPVGTGHESVHDVEVEPRLVVVDLIFVLGYQHAYRAY
jgi:hypothetical protein